MIPNRAGFFMQQPAGYKSFVPSPLPPDPPIQIDAEMFQLLSDADRKLGRLDGITEILPNPQLFVNMYVLKEAVLSSQIEGTQASLSDVLGKVEDENDLDIGEVSNYAEAMYYGLERLESFPMSLRLIREIHARLLKTGRGSDRSPGEFRSTQNWIGPPGCTLSNAIFIPPAPADMDKSLSDLELYFHDDTVLPVLIKIALIHAQFETIHPFLDGNGRVGRLLITFWLCQQRVLNQPLLYLSYYFKENRTEYYDRLMAVRYEGDWEGWIKFFLKGIAEVSDEATSTAKEIINLKKQCEDDLNQRNASANMQKMVDYIFESPIFSIRDVEEKLGVSYPTASSLVTAFIECGYVEDMTPDRQRKKKYRFKAYVELLNRGTELNGNIN